MASTDAVVAGVDGSRQSLQAALWAAAEARRQQASLHLVIANDDPLRAEYTKRAVREAAQACHQQAPELDVTDEIATGRPADVLVGRSKQARVIVVGSRGGGGFTDALLGSVSSAVAAHGECPVVVVRGSSPTTGPVVVGVDDSPGSQAALRFGLQAADQRTAEVIALQTWHDERFGLAAPGPLSPEDREQFQRQIERSLAQQVAQGSADFPNVRPRTLVHQGHPVAALSDASRDAQLLVVGHRGRGGFQGLFMGSVAFGVLHHAHCPVAVVPIKGKDQSSINDAEAP